MDDRVIRNCPVAVVGGAGFLGSHLVNHLIEDRGCRVLVIDNLVSGRREFVHRDATFEHHDITGSEEWLAKAFASHGIEYVFNYAASPYVPLSFIRPAHVCNVNFFGAMRVINAAHEAGAKAILQVSSAEIYGGFSIPDKADDMDWRIDEGDEVMPHSSYGVSKLAADYYCQCAWRERQVPVIALRQFNCVGERETHPYVIPEIVGQLAKWKEPQGSSLREGVKYVPTVRLGNNSFRDFLYAGDQAAMATKLLEDGEFGEVYNLGSESGVRIYDLAQLIGEVMGFAGVEVVEDATRKRPWEIWFLLSDNTKIYQAIDRRPKVSLREALERTVAWYRDAGNRWPWE